jgi:hypothetical protein
VDTKNKREVIKMLAVRLSSHNNKYFIMDESCGPDGKLRGQVPGHVNMQGGQKEKSTER